jgi:hypothetical protein
VRLFVVAGDPMITQGSITGTLTITINP